MRKHLLVCGWLVLAACSTVRLGPTLWMASPSPCHSEITIRLGDPGADFLGMRYGFTRIPQEIIIKPGMPTAQEQRVVAHELFHALGYGPHADHPDCVSYAAGYPVMPLEPCPEELGALRRVKRTFKVVKCDPCLGPSLETAVEFWNKYAERIVLVVDDRAYAQ